MTNKTDNPTEKTQAPKKSIAREYTEAILIALLLALLIRTFIVQAFKIPSGSMKKTLLIGDHILVSKFSYGTHIPNEIPFINVKLFDDIVLFSKVPQRGDIIVFKFPKDETRDFIKRVIGLPGDLLEVKRQKVYINNKPYKDIHARHTDSPSDSPLVPRDDFGPILVPDDHVFVMGDNRENSQDSRYWGYLNVKKIRGKAQIIYWSWDRIKSWVRFERFGKILK
ncbi:MAG: signal peptidase I [Nitrospinia bacterium]|tara:strand:+ start:1004 stop:1675 length:672 start_codon:yes stop_codon:yes gene_type:complete